MISVSGTTIQLLDDSNLQAVAAASQDKTPATTRIVAERERPSAMDGWVGGTWVSQGNPFLIVVRRAAFTPTRIRIVTGVFPHVVKHKD